MMRQMMLFHKSNSGAIARSRLKLLLVADKAYLSPGLLSRIRDDLVVVLSRYAEVDSGQMDLRLTRMEAAGNQRRTAWFCLLPSLSGQFTVRGMKNVFKL